MMLEENDSDFASDDDLSWGGELNSGGTRKISVGEVVRRGIEEGVRNAQQMSDEEFDRMLAEIEAGKTLAEIQNIGEDSMEALYAFGYSYYNAERYEEAMEFFKHLVMLNHMEKRYYFGVAGCLQGLKKYAQALDVYSTLFLLDEDDPHVAFNAGICSLALGELDSARQAFDLTGEIIVRQLDSRPELVELGDRVVGLIENIDSRMAAKNAVKK